MKRKVIRTALSLLVAVGCVLVFRWTIRAAMGRAYSPKRTVGSGVMRVESVPRVHSLEEIVHEDLHINIAGLPIRNTAKRLGMPYALAADLADEMAKSEGWTRVGDEEPLTVRSLTGMERLYRTPSGALVLRELTPVKGDDTLMEDLFAPVDLLGDSLGEVLPDELARRSARRTMELMPAILRDVVVGSPMMTHLIRRGNGAAFLVHSLSPLSAKYAMRAVESAAEKSGWKSMAIPDEELPPEMCRATYSKENISFVFEVVPRADGTGCDIDYRFSDDEVYDNLTKGKINED